MPVLAREHIDAFWHDGFLMVEDVVMPAQLGAFGSEIDTVEESRALIAPFGPPTIDGRPRFDMGSCKINLKLSGATRPTEGLVELPKQPKSASFFTVLGQESKQAAE